MNRFKLNGKWYKEAPEVGGLWTACKGCAFLVDDAGCCDSPNCNWGGQDGAIFVIDPNQSEDPE